MKKFLESIAPLAVSAIVYFIGRAIRSIGYHYTPSLLPGPGTVSYDGFAGFIGVIIMYLGIFGGIISICFFISQMSNPND